VCYYNIFDVKLGKRKPFTLDKFEEFFKLLPERADSERSWTVTREEIEAKNFDLKAVNPHTKIEEDTRTPEELLDLIVIGREGVPLRGFHNYSSATYLLHIRNAFLFGKVRV